MSGGQSTFVWGNSAAYEAYMGRWSLPLAEAFVDRLALPQAGQWVDVGCGTGSLTQAILAAAHPREVVGVDPSPDFIDAARSQIGDHRVRFVVGDAQTIPLPSDHADAVVIGLALNLVPDPSAGLAEMARVARPGGTVGGYVWDYGGKMQLVRSFWDAVSTLDPDAGRFDQAVRYPFCQPEPLRTLCIEADLRDVEVEAIDLPMPFRDFDDYWHPHVLDGPSPAQRYVASLDEGRRQGLRELLRETLPIAEDGAILLTARAWAFRGRKGNKANDCC